MGSQICYDYLQFTHHLQGRLQQGICVSAAYWHGKPRLVKCLLCSQAETMDGLTLSLHPFRWTPTANLSCPQKMHVGVLVRLLTHADVQHVLRSSL